MNVVVGLVGGLVVLLKTRTTCDTREEEIAFIIQDWGWLRSQVQHFSAGESFRREFEYDTKRDDTTKRRVTNFGWKSARAAADELVKDNILSLLCRLCPS